MIGPKDHLGFTDDDLDLSPEAARRRMVIERAEKATFYFRMAMAIVIAPMILALLVQALRSELPNRWMAFWIVVAIIGAIIAALEVGIVRKQRRAARRSVGLE